MTATAIDLEGRSFAFELPSESFNLSQLCDSLSIAASMDLSRSAICHEGVILSQDDVFSASNFAGSSPFVIFNYTRYPEKSYPRCDRAFSFTSPRYSEFAASPTAQQKTEKDLMCLFTSPVTAPSPERNPRLRDGTSDFQARLMRLFNTHMAFDYPPSGTTLVRGRGEPDYYSDEDQGHGNPDEPPIRAVRPFRVVRAQVLPSMMTEVSDSGSDDDD
jgi:hypothetical protein